MSTKFKKEFQSSFLIQLLKTIQWVVARLPRRIVHFFIHGLFAVAYVFLKKLRHICIKNLQAVYGQAQHQKQFEQMTKSCIENIGHSMMDMLYYVDRPEKLLEVTTIHGEDRLQEALKFGRGAIMITAHLGNFPLMFESLVQKGYKVNVIIRPMRDDKFGQFMHGLCGKWNIKMIELSPPKEFLKKALGALRRNELLFIMLDEAIPEGSGVKVDFFNKQVERATGPVLFHERVGSPILPAFIVKNDQNKFDIFIEEALKTNENAHEELRELKSIAELTKVIESFVKLYPMQWGGWLNKRWN